MAVTAPRTQLVPISVIKTIERYGLFVPGEKVLVAFSGGPDSSALLYILLRLKKRYGIALHVAYLNHRLRGQESDAEQRFVEKTAASLGLPITIEHLTDEQVAQLSSGSLEARARAARLSFLQRSAKTVQAAKIALGHTFEDQVETVLMRLFVGTGPEGFAGMRPISGKLVRPLIETSKAELASFLKENNLGYFTDSSNLSTSFLRNRIRHLLLPRIVEIFGPAALRKVVSFAKIVAEESDTLDQIAKAAFLDATVPDKQAISLSIEKLQRMQHAIRTRVLRIALKAAGLDAQSLGAAHVAQTDSLIFSQRPDARLPLPKGLVVQKKGDLILIWASPPRYDAPEPFEIDLVVPGKARIASWDATLEASVINSAIPKPPPCTLGALLDADFSLGHGRTLKIRPPSKTDTFTPLGMKTSVRVIDFLKKCKVPARLRRAYPLVVREDGRVLWVVAKRIDEAAKITPKSKAALRLTIQKAQSGPHESESGAP